MVQTAETIMQFDVFTALEDLSAHGDYSALHDIAGRLFENDTQLVRTALRWLKSVGLVEENGGAFRVVEGAELELPRRRAPALAPASKPSAKKPTAKKPAAKAVRRKASVAKPSAAAAKPKESFQDKCRTIGERALRRLPALPAGQGLHLIPGYSNALAPEMVWTQPQTSPLLRVGDRVQPLLDACEGKVTMVASREVRGDLG